ncbi:MAG: type 4a pilus biogenesis protein PilO [Firmicutes bacterium]|jgi:type IV pilus assembly protein PilO|nr:type 4a pilus biogenesis protein PilO [Bacillota bacterium]
MAVSMEVNPKQLKLFVALVAVAAVVGLYLYVFSPQADRYARAKAKLSEAETQLQASLIRLKRIPAAEQELTASILELDAFENLVPDEDKVHYIYRDIEAVAQKNLVTVTSVTVASGKVRGPYLELPITVEMEGRYAEILDFVQGLASLSRVINFRSFSLTAGAPVADGGPKGVLRASAQVSTFVRPKGGGQSGAAATVKAPTARK